MRIEHQISIIAICARILELYENCKAHSTFIYAINYYVHPLPELGCFIFLIQCVQMFNYTYYRLKFGCQLQVEFFIQDPKQNI